MNWYWGVFKKYNDFKGRASRSEYWYFSLFNILIVIVLCGICLLWRPFWAVYILYALGVIIPHFAVTVRRLHDAGNSGFWLLVFFVPIFGFFTLLYFLVQPSQAKKNEHGPAPQ